MRGEHTYEGSRPELSAADHPRVRGEGTPDGIDRPAPRYGGITSRVRGDGTHGHAPGTSTAASDDPRVRGEKATTPPGFVVLGVVRDHPRVRGEHFLT